MIKEGLSLVRRVMTSCRICIELNSFLTRARIIDPPERLRGLTEIGERNRKHQYQERVEKATTTLQKHQAQCIHVAAGWQLPSNT